MHREPRPFKPYPAYKDSIDGLVARVPDGIDRLKELRTALISAAVTGKIDIRAG